MTVPPRATIGRATGSILVLVVAVACSPTSSPSEGGSGAASAASTGTDCEPIRIHSPSGGEVSLTGSWHGTDNATYVLHQFESCVYWMGMSDPENGEPAGYLFTNVFIGDIAPDFTIRGRWSDVPYFTTPWSLLQGTMTLGIEYSGIEPVDQPMLRQLVLNNGWQTSVFYPEETLSEEQALAGTYRTTLGACAWIEIEGEAYELAPSTRYAYSAEGAIFDRDDNNTLIARPGDEISVVGRTAPYPGVDACQDRTLLAATIEPAAQ